VLLHEVKEQIERTLEHVELDLVATLHPHLFR
jgi:hypothetical protein